MPDAANLSTIRKQALAELSKWCRELEPLLQPELGPEQTLATLSELPSELERLLVLMPDPGWRASQMRSFSMGGAIYIAIYLVLHRRGKTAAQVWPICEQATRNRFARMPALSQKLMSWALFSTLWKLLTAYLAGRSQNAAVGGWKLAYLPKQPGQFDYGVTYHRCAIFQLAKDVGATEFAPFICQADIVGSDVFGWGLQRTETLAQGGKCCDFRFRKGQRTEVTSKLPIIS